MGDCNAALARNKEEHSMSESAPSSAEKRPEFRNIHAFRDLPGYRWPPAAVVSGMHRASGLMLFLLLPFIIWMFDLSLIHI